MKVILRLLLLLIWLTLGFFWLLIFKKFFNDRFLKKTLIVFGKVFIAICGLKISCKNDRFLKYCKNTVIISNHISWLDIFVIHSVGIPGIFIAKSEIRRWPLLGLLISNAGTIFIDRTKRSSIVNVFKKSRSLLLEGKVIIFFPEGTTSEGSEILPFHTSFFSLFLDSPEAKLLPIVIKYRKMGRRSIEPAYVGEMSLLDSIIKVLGSNNLEVCVEVLDCISNNEKLILTKNVQLKRNLAESIRIQMLSKL